MHNTQIQNLICDIEFNTRELQSIIVEMRSNIQSIPAQTHTLLHDKDAMLYSSIESHIARDRKLYEAWSSLDKKTEALTVKSETLARSYRALQASHSVEKAWQENTKAVNIFLSANLEINRALEELRNAFKQHNKAREDYKKVCDIWEIVLKFPEHGANLSANTEKLSENNNDLKNQTRILKSSTDALLDGNTALTYSELLVNKCVLLEGTRNVLHQERSTIIHQCNELISRPLIRITQEDPANSCPVNAWVWEEYTMAGKMYDKSGRILAHVSEESNRALQGNIQIFQEYNKALKLYNRILGSDLKTEENKDEESGDCSICLCELECGQKVIKWTKCLHLFHDHCILDWVPEKSTCPLCREPLPE